MGWMNCGTPSFFWVPIALLLVAGGGWLLARRAFDRFAF